MGLKKPGIDGLEKVEFLESESQENSASCKGLIKHETSQ